MSLVPQKDAVSIGKLATNGIGNIPKIGQTALVIGINGKFVKTTVNSVVSSKKSDNFDNTGISLIEDISSKMSGAPVLSSDGKIIGIVVPTGEGIAGIIGADSINYAIKASKIVSPPSAPAPAQ